MNILNFLQILKKKVHEQDIFWISHPSCVTKNNIKLSYFYKTNNLKKPLKYCHIQFNY